MNIHAKVKKWGNSLGLVIPKEAVQELDIEENQEVQVEIKKPKHISEFYGALKGKKIRFDEEDRLDVRS